MKRRGPALMAAAINLALAVAAFSWPSNSEPVYKGKKLSEWLSVHSHWRFSERLQEGEATGRPMLRAEDFQEAQAVEAVQAIGTNAFPCLLRWISYETPRWRTWANGIAPRLPSVVQRSRPCRWICDDSEAQKRAQLAVEGFYILGPKALPAVKELTRIDRAVKPAPQRVCVPRMGSRANVLMMVQPQSHAWIAMSYIGKRIPGGPDGLAISNTVAGPGPRIFKRAVAVDRPDEFWFLQN